MYVMVLSKQLTAENFQLTLTLVMNVITTEINLIYCHTLNSRSFQPVFHFIFPLQENHMFFHSELVWLLIVNIAFYFFI